nr:ABC transporter permease/substrate-binding protein [Pseudopedobacter sp.]
MEQINSFLQFISQESDKLLNQTLQHIGLTFISLFIAILVALPLGIFISRKIKLAGPILGVAGILQTIPSIALLGVMIPILGIGVKPAIVALFLYALLPIIRNTYTGITNLDAQVLEAAKAMGMSKSQILRKVELPLAFPIIMAGIRTATVINVGVATLAAYIAAGGLGEFIFGGIALNNTNMILAGAIPAALLAIIFDFLLSRLQQVNFRNIKTYFLILPFLLVILSSFYFLPTAIEGKMLAGFTPEFMGRQDGDLGLRKVYGLKIRTVVISDAVMYRAVFEKKLDVISGYSTDGRLKAFDLVTLVDDQHIFPPYYAAPIANEKVLQKHPELERILNQLAGMIDDSTMTNLNYKVDYLHQSPEKVAKDFLVVKGLYKNPKNGNGDLIKIGSKIFGEQYILAQMYKILILGNSDLQVETKTGLGGTKICFDALTNNQIDFYPEYTGTGLLVILPQKPQLFTKIMSDKEQVYSYVQKEFNKNYHIKWLRPIGFNNTYALMMRKQQAQNLVINSITDLQRHLENNK